MISLLRLASLVFACLGCYWVARELATRSSNGSDWRLCWAFAATLWGSIVTAIVEITSSLGLFAAPWVLLAWAFADVCLVIVGPHLGRKRQFCPTKLFSESFTAIRQVRLSDWPADAKWFLGGTALLVSFLFGLAVTMPTANWDSLTYHLPRILHWIQQQ